MNGAAREAIVLPDAAALAEAAAQRLIGYLLERQSWRSPVHVALTGGHTGIAVLEHARSNALLGAVSWPDIHFWWGDERFVPADSPDRNDVQARRALLDHLPEPSGGVHPAATAGTGVSLADAARRYTAELRRHHVVFDLVLLGVGPDGHVASIFPESAGAAGLAAAAGTAAAGQPPPKRPAEAPKAATASDKEPAAQAAASTPAAFAVADSPKPPPERVSLTLPTICAAREVWLVAAGEPKRAAARRALTGPPDPALPASLVQGRDRTLWFLDADAAAPA
ncbi:MAG: 6-phosphogluconolactonase [Bifidobacteriaceae bacterium]|jgi:6-phosphogluconolactonase|nr:6-phosphogluconolactonase [Bifidobacteriaceae bacterium]